MKHFMQKIRIYIDEEKYNFIPFLPVFIILGIILFFQYKIPVNIHILLIFGLIIFFACIFSENLLQKILITIFFVILGVIISYYRLNSISKHKIRQKMYNIKITGIVDQIFLGSEKNKIILKDITINKYLKRLTPEKIQFKSDKSIDIKNVKPNDLIEFHADLYPLPKPVYPNAYNFSDISKFKNIGGIGKVQSEIIILNKSRKTTFQSFIESVRLYIDNLIGKRMKYSNASGIAMALFTGNTGYIQQDVIKDIQKSGLSHLLAISGINISIVAITIFAILRKLFSYSEYITLHYNTKKISAIIAIMISFFHLQISGLPISAVRSFIMFALGLICVILNRYPTPMRIISFTLFVILMQKPEGIFDPSLQMSFMAVLGLIATMGSFSRWIDRKYGDGGKIIRFFLYFIGILAASIVSTFATFCYSVYHFNQYSNIGLISNILAVPISELGMIPLGVVGLSLSIFGIGLDYPFLKLMEFMGIIFIKIANFTANVKGSYILIPEMPMKALFFYTFGLIILFTMTTKLRRIGWIFIVMAVFLHINYPKPIAIIGRNNQDMVFFIEEKYYKYSNFSSDFLEAVWSGRLAQSKIETISEDTKKQYFITYKDAICYKKDRELLICIANKFNKEICDIVNSLDGKSIIIDRNNMFHSEMCPLIKTKIIKQWIINQNGAFVLRKD